jgi:uncharacterized protein (TIGR02452 family)
MTDRQNPGGGVLGGAGAQEENIFRRSNIFLSLYQFVDYSNYYNIKRNFNNSYPLDRNSGGIYSKNVTVFRASERNGYCFLQNPFEISVISVPAINRPNLNFINGEYFITKELIEPSKEKIRSILRICGEFGMMVEQTPKAIAEGMEKYITDKTYLTKYIAKTKERAVIFSDKVIQEEIKKIL